MLHFCDSWALNYARLCYKDRAGEWLLRHLNIWGFTVYIVLIVVNK